MSARLTAKQNKIRLITGFLFTVMLVLVLRVYQGLQAQGAANAAVSSAPTGVNAPLDASLFMGLRHASAIEIHQAWPEAAGKPAVLYMGSRLCHDCQRLSPLVLQLMSQHPDIAFKKLDVLEDQQKAAAILRTFKPVSVPVVVFINAQGDIRNVLYDYQTPPVLAKALSTIQPAAPVQAKRKPQTKALPSAKQ